MDVALDEAGKVIKKQKVCATRVADSLDKLIQLAQQSRQQLAAGSSDAIQQLQAQAEQLGLLKDMNSSTKELHSSINKLSKVRVARCAEIGAVDKRPACFVRSGEGCCQHTRMHGLSYTPLCLVSNNPCTPTHRCSSYHPHIGRP